MDLLPDPGSAPAYFQSREISRGAPRITTPRERFSFLRNEIIQSAVAHRGEDMNMKPLFAFMERIGGRKLSTVEQDLTRKWIHIDSEALSVILKRRIWATWPKEPTSGIEKDPGERHAPADDGEDWFKYMKKWNRKYNRGEITSERLRKAFEASVARQAAASVVK